jgi:hypothetical protein
MIKNDAPTFFCFSFGLWLNVIGSGTLTRFCAPFQVATMDDVTPLVEQAAQLSEDLSLKADAADVPLTADLDRLVTAMTSDLTTGLGLALQAKADAGHTHTQTHDNNKKKKKYKANKNRMKKKTEREK